jgi:hypothetical protein
MPLSTTIRRRVTQACAALLVVLAVFDVLAMILGHDWSTFTFIEAIVWAALATGLFMELAFARRATALLLLLAAIVLPIGYINPFNAGDMMAQQGVAPSVTHILLWMVPVEALLLFAVWAIDPLRAGRSRPDVGNAEP